jgi:pimeloyl-ACP methyl ester carboxylesterase
MSVHSTRRLAVAACLILSLVTSAAPAQASPPTQASPPGVAWSPCFHDFGPFQCATVPVPLDHDKPNGATVLIALVRFPASDQAAKIGSIFLNPGGPGGSGIDFALGVAPLFEAVGLTSSFDIVGFDPRGIGRSTGVRCFGTQRQWGRVLAPYAFPFTEEEEGPWIAGELQFDETCDQRAGRILDHMATADVARDLDRLRAAVGDEKLTYLGISYGTYLGNTFANLFPDNFRAMVLDSALDPVAWSTGEAGEEGLPFSTRLRSSVGAGATLDEFFRLCDAGGPNCAFAGDSAARFAALADQLKAGPIEVVDPVTGAIVPFRYQDLIINALISMYDAASWPALAEFFTFIEQEASSVTLGHALAKLWVAQGYISKRGFPRYFNALEGFPAVACSDSDNPDDYAVWSEVAPADDAAHGYFGRPWTWTSSICAQWPGADADRYMGPFDADTAAPILFLNNLFDPATRYEGAVDAEAALPNAALITVNGWGHGAAPTSSCAIEAVVGYLFTGVSPGDLSCDPDVVPFAEPAAAVAQARNSGFGRPLTPTWLLPDRLRSAIGR